ncbi:hypothetical protein [Hyalangium minutum]|uniref:hypothetical protein n=1 Tax=Hyalangium minutum TaxID=394096 RepID=UPI0012F88FB5|nr:hypothetical protein [Hyalangium minutum]
MVNCLQSPRPFELPWRPLSVSVPRQQRRPPLWLLGLLCLSCSCLGYGKTQVPECKRNLKAIFTAFMVTQNSPRGSEPPLGEQLGPLVERGNRYAYFVGEGPLEQRSGKDAQRVAGAMGVGVDLFKFQNARPLTLRDVPSAVAAEVGLHGTCPDCRLVAACAGDTDNKPLDAPDVWSISSEDRVIDGETIPAGQPYHHLWDTDD